MQMIQAQQIQIGDIVRWIDPDGGNETNYLVAAISVGPETVTITDPHGCVVEAPPEELHQVCAAIPGVRFLDDKTYDLVVTALAQSDYAFYHGDGDCAEAAERHLALALHALGQRTSQDEDE